MTYEYRVVNIDAPGLKYNPFKCFDTESSARHFMEHGAFSYSAAGSAVSLERRPAGSSPDQWEEIDRESQEIREQRKKQLQPK